MDQGSNLHESNAQKETKVWGEFNSFGNGKHLVFSDEGIKIEGDILSPKNTNARFYPFGSIHYLKFAWTGQVEIIGREKDAKIIRFSAASKQYGELKELISKAKAMNSAATYCAPMDIDSNGNKTALPLSEQSERKKKSLRPILLCSFVIISVIALVIALYFNDGDSSFTNRHGKPDTKCAYSGCSKTIASSGDTAYCAKHSNKCLYCKKYIDNDASVCMDCIRKALN